MNKLFIFQEIMQYEYDFKSGEIPINKINKNASKYPVILVKGINLKRDEYGTEVKNNG